MRKINSGVVGGFCFLLFSLVFFFLSFELPYTSLAGPGPMFFPVWLSAIMGVLSLVYIVQSLHQRKGLESAEGRPQKLVAFVCLCLFLFVFILDYAGFVAASTAFLFSLLYKSYKWYASLVIALVVSVCLFLLFGPALGLQLPVNALGF